VIVPEGNNKVSGIDHRRRHIWRRLVSCLVAYAFALQAVLFAFAVPAVAGLAPDRDTLSAALCLHDKNAPLAPANNSSGDEHCKFCPLGGHHVFTTPAMAPHAVVRTAERASRPAGDLSAPRARTHVSAQPRGPPLAA
jgi:hypothetical protein